MRKEDFLKLGLEDGMAQKCADAVSEMLKGYIPKARFDEVNGEKKKLETDVSDRDRQLDELKKSGADTEALRAQIEQYKQENKAKDEAHAAEIRKIKIENSIGSALTAAKARNSKAVEALLKDMDKAVFLEDGSIKGLKEQIDALKVSDAYLFEAEKSPDPKVKGAVPGESGDNGLDGKPKSEWTYDDFVRADENSAE